MKNSLLALYGPLLDGYTSVKEEPKSVSALKELLLHIHNLNRHLNPITIEDYYLIDEEWRNNELKSLQQNMMQMFPTMTESLFNKLKGEIEEEYNRRYLYQLTRLSQALEPFAVPESHANWFELNGIKLSLVQFSDLPAPAKEIIMLEAKRISANWLGGESEYDVNALVHAYRAPLWREFNSLHDRRALIATENVEFESFIGPQVSLYRTKNGYSGEVVHIVVPGYLFQKHWQYNLTKPTIHSRFPFKISKYLIE